MSKNRLVRYVADQDLRLGYDGLNKKVPLTNLGQGEFVAFVNRAKDKVKLATGNDVILYHRMTRNKKLDPRVIMHLPRYLNGSRIDYDSAMRELIHQQFPKWFDK